MPRSDALPSIPAPVRLPRPPLLLAAALALGPRPWLQGIRMESMGKKEALDHVVRSMLLKHIGLVLKERDESEERLATRAITAGSSKTAAVVKASQLARLPSGGTVGKGGAPADAEVNMMAARQLQA